MIQYIYFDVGGVVIRDFSKTNKWEDLMKELQFNEEQKKIFSQVFMSIEPELCNGKKNLGDFLDQIQSKINYTFEKNYSLLDAFVERFERNQTIHNIIQALSKKYKLGLLTNMYPNMLKAIEKKNILPKITWNNIIDSSVEKYGKPQIEIYKIAEKQSGYSGKEILFIDNTEENLETAKQMGWNTLLYDPSNISESNKKISTYLMKHQIITNICYTEGAYDRINKKLQTNLSRKEIEKMLLDVITNTDEQHFERRGKNIYISSLENHIQITININTYRVITVNKTPKK